MKKMAAFFSDSAREFQNVRTVTACGLFAALAFILESFSIQLGEYIKIGFSGLPNEMVDFLLRKLQVVLKCDTISIRNLLSHTMWQVDNSQ